MIFDVEVIYSLTKIKKEGKGIVREFPCILLSAQFTEHPSRSSWMLLLVSFADLQQPFQFGIILFFLENRRHDRG